MGINRMFCLITVVILFFSCSDKQQSHAANNLDSQFYFGDSLLVDSVASDDYAILGLTFGMQMYYATNSLSSIGLRNYEKMESDRIIYKQPVTWDGVMYDLLTLSYCWSNRQNAFLEEIDLVRLYDNIEEAKQLMNIVKYQLIDKYGKDCVEEDLDENRLPKVTVYEQIGRSVRKTRIFLTIFPFSDDSSYFFRYTINGWTQGQMAAQNDNF